MRGERVGYRGWFLLFGFDKYCRTKYPNNIPATAPTQFARRSPISKLRERLLICNCRNSNMGKETEGGGEGETEGGGDGGTKR